MIPDLLSVATDVPPLLRSVDSQEFDATVKSATLRRLIASDRTHTAEALCL